MKSGPCQPRNADRVQRPVGPAVRGASDDATRLRRGGWVAAEREAGAGGAPGRAATARRDLETKFGS